MMIGSSSAPDPYWVLLTAIWQTGILGGGAYFFLIIFVPWITKFDSLHEVAPDEKERMQKALWGFFRKAKRWPDNPIGFMASYVSKGIAFLTLAGVQAAIVLSIGWKAPVNWDNVVYDLVFARSTKDLNSAHLASYILIPALGLYVAWKFRTGDGMLNCYLGLIVAALGVVIHEGEWLVGYYAFYSQYMNSQVIYNVLGDAFFVVMLAIFFYTYRQYPFQEISLSKFKWVAICLGIYLVLWALDGYHISTANNFLIGHTQYNITQWWPDLKTNAWEVGSWVWTYALMFITVARAKAAHGDRGRSILSKTSRLRGSSGLSNHARPSIPNRVGTSSVKDILLAIGAAIPISVTLIYVFGLMP